MHLEGAPGCGEATDEGRRRARKRHHRYTRTEVCSACPAPAVPPQTLLPRGPPQSHPHPGLQLLRFHSLPSPSSSGRLLLLLSFASSWRCSRKISQGWAEVGTRQRCRHPPSGEGMFPWGLAGAGGGRRACSRGAGGAWGGQGKHGAGAGAGRSRACSGEAKGSRA